jgi:thiamine kinase-like enzyme
MLSHADAAVVARDPALPGLALLMDDEALQDVIVHSQLGTEIDAVHADYLRYKPGTNCLARLRFQANGVDTFGYAITYRHKAKRKLGRGAFEANRRISKDGGVTCEHVVIYRFPHDRRLPALSKLGTDGDLRQLLSRIAPTFASEPNIQLKTLRYKPERRYVAQLLLVDQPVAALKLYSFDAYGAARRAEKTVSGMQANCFARCFGHSNSHGALLFEWEQGATSLLSTLSGDSNGLQLCSAASAVQRLHSQRFAKLPIRTRDEYLHQLGTQFVQLQWMLDEQSTILDAIFNAVTQRLSDSVEPQFVSCHGDLHPEQLVCGKRGSILLDFDRACLAEAASDLGYLWAEWRTQDDPESYAERDTLFETFLDAYQSFGGTLDRERIRAYAAGRLIALAGECFRHRRADWRKDAQHRIDQAAMILGVAPPGATRIHGTSSARRPSISPQPGRLATALCRDQVLGPAVAIDFESAAQVLQRCESFDGNHSGITLESMRMLRHKPGRRCLIEYTGRSCSTGEIIKLLGKVDAKRRQQRYFDQQLQLWNSGFRSDNADGISVARPWAAIDAWQMWLQQRGDGENGWHALKRSTAASVARRVAHGLAKLHQSRLCLDREHQIDDELAILKQRLPIAASRLPSLRARIESLLDNCAQLAQFAAPTQVCPIHRDFYPDQYLTSGDKVVLLDFDLLSLGDPAIDVGNLLAHLVEYSLRYYGRTDEYADFAATITQEYRLQMPLVTVDAIEFCTLFSLVRHIWLCSELPGRQENAVRVLEACEQYIQRLGRTRFAMRHDVHC